MEFWNDYEGKTFAHRFEIGKLLRSGGRSAQFHVIDTGAGKRTEAVLRLTESLNGEHAMLDCWHRVQQAHQPHLIEIRETGETVYDGVPLTWALLEKHDMELADLLRERFLTPDEATDVARALIAAVQALHAHGLVHDAILPEHVQAVGETVKLRSDTVRVFVEDGEFVSHEECESRRREDIVAVAATLLESLTGRRDLSGVRRLQGSLDAVIRHAFDGTWSLEQMSSYLAPLAAPVATTTPGNTASPDASTPVPTVAEWTPPAIAEGATVTARTANAPVSAGLPRGAAGLLGQAAAKRNGSQTLPFPETASPTPHTPPAAEPRISTRNLRPVQASRPRRSVSTDHLRNPKLLAACAAVLLALVIGWGLLGTHHATHPQLAAVAPAPVASIAPAPQPSAAAPAPAIPSSSPAAEPRYAAGWRVVVYTYRHEEQALAKAAKLRERFRAMSPAVFTPQNGVYLVALGGPMSEQDAEALRSRARRSGLPRDTFIRNYRVNN